MCIKKNIADNSKIHFNIGLIFASANEHDRAVNRVEIDIAISGCITLNVCV
jgi:hypothetical protein